MQTVRIHTRGMTFIDVLVGSALIAIVFAGIIAGFRYAIELIAISRGEQGALSIAGDQLEVMRALPYTAVGTVGGIPPGDIPQVETIELNDITYTKRVLVQYVDAPEDGLDGEDENGITADYKRVRVEVSWESRGKTYEEVLMTNIVPKGIETTAGGGTIRITVFDSVAQPVADAAVRIVNASTSPLIDVTTYSNNEGVVLFSGAPAAAGYAVSATKSGFSTAQTYAVTAENPNPNPGHIAVAETQTSGLSFAIDQLSATTVRTLEAPRPATTTDTFAGHTHIAATSNTTIADGNIVLSQNGGQYASSGTVRSTDFVTDEVYAWTAFSWRETSSTSTNVTYQLYYESAGTPTLVPDSVLAGNSTGFTTSPVNLSSVNPDAYPNLMIGATLSTTDVSVTPQIHDWTLAYTEAVAPLPNITFALTGSKTIGSDSNGMPLHKYDALLTTDGRGERVIDGMEWDTYALSISGSTGYDIQEICPVRPFVLSPGTEQEVDVILAVHTERSLQVTVVDTAGRPIPGASVQLIIENYDETRNTTACGQTFFPSLAEGEYTLNITANGHASDSRAVQIDGTHAVTIMLTTI